MKNILITGGAGFIGSNLSLKLLDLGYNVTVLDNLSNQIHGENPENKSVLFLSIKDKVNFIKGSVTERSDWIKAIIDQDAIIHLAAETGTGQSMYEIEKYTKVNIGGTSILLDILANIKHNVKKIIVASSRSIYGEGKYWSDDLNKFVYPQHRTADYMSKGDFEVKYKGAINLLKLIATDEDAKIHPSSVYGITKQNQEQLIMTVCPTIGVIPVAFRFQNVYGPGQSLSNPYTGILSIFSTLIMNDKDINIFEDGKESRDFVYIDDVVDATILGLEKNDANCEVFNVGTGEATNVITVANKLISNYKKNINIVVSGNFRLGDIRHNYADISKINSLLGFIPKYNFDEGIQNFAKWVSTQEITESKYQDSIEEMKQKGLFK
jgi:dTDP-L-rhamnose 4-epimerase